MNNTTVSSRALVEHLYESLASGELGSALSVLSPDAVVHVPGRYDGAGDFVGIDAVLGFLLDTAAHTDDGDHYELIDVLEGADHLAAYCRVRATRAGREPLDNLTVHLARVTDGRISEVWFHNRDDAAVEAFRS